jgi:hypothetical protein
MNPSESHVGHSNHQPEGRAASETTQSIPILLRQKPAQLARDRLASSARANTAAGHFPSLTRVPSQYAPCDVLPRGRLLN